MLHQHSCALIGIRRSVTSPIMPVNPMPHAPAVPQTGWHSGGGALGARSTGQYHLDVVDVRAERPAAMIFLPYVRGDAAAERFVCLPTTAISETAPLIRSRGQTARWCLVSPS